MGTKAQRGHLLKIIKRTNEIHSQAWGNLKLILFPLFCENEAKYNQKMENFGSFYSCSLTWMGMDSVIILLKPGPC